MSQLTELMGLIGDLNQVIEAQGNQIEQLSKSMRPLMGAVVQDIDGTGSKHVGDVKDAISNSEQALRKALDALSEARSAIYALLAS